MGENKSLMTAEEVAKYLNVDETTIYVWAKEGKIPAAKLGRLWRFDGDEIEKWVKSKKSSAAGEQKE